MINTLVEKFVDESNKTKKRFEHIIAIQKKEIKPNVGVTPFEVLGKYGRCRLLYFAPIKNEGHSPLFIVPSIINKYYILDLQKGMSFVEYLTSSNIPVYLIDWGEPRLQDRTSTIEDHILHWLDWGILESCTHAGVTKIDLFGQCIGGTFAMIYTALKQEKIKSLIALTAPVNFHDTGLLSVWTNQGKINLEMISDQWGNVYSEFLKESFGMLKPLDRIRKYNNFYKNAWNPKFLNRYLAINHWVDDCIAFPGTTYVKYIQDFYQQNLLYKGELKIGKEVVDLKKIKCPVFVISSKEDIIVPYGSAAALLEVISSEIKELKQINGGHIGIVISSKAKESFWSPIENWIKVERRLA